MEEHRDSPIPHQGLTWSDPQVTVLKVVTWLEAMTELGEQSDRALISQHQQPRRSKGRQSHCFRTGIYKEERIQKRKTKNKKGRTVKKQAVNIGI